MIDFVIIDDEPDAIEVLKIHLSKIPFMQLKAAFRDPLDALEYLQVHSVDLIFLDINMPKVSGMRFPKFLSKPPLIVFTTAYSEYALESYELQAVDYLLKPIEFDRLLQAVMKVKNMLSGHISTKTDLKQGEKLLEKNSIFIKSGSEFHQIAIQDIKYVESEGNYVTFFTTTRKVVARYKLSEVVELLPKHYFERIHRSYIVALQHLETVKKYAVIIDGQEIAIGSNYREDFLKRIEGDQD